MNEFKKGFTLIELLVVIAIIGILSSVVLASLNSARSRGVDSAIIGAMDSLRAQITLIYDTNNLSYNSGATIQDNATCQSRSDVGTIFSDTRVQAILNNAYTRSGYNLVCNVQANSYMISVRYKSDTNKWWCLDNLSAHIWSGAAIPAQTDTVCQ